MDDCLNFVVFVEKKLVSGNCSIQVGRRLLARQSWAEAARALNKGIEKGNLDDTDEACALLAKCHSLMENAEEHLRATNDD